MTIDADFTQFKAQADAADPNLLLSLAEAAGNQMAAVTAIMTALNYPTRPGNRRYQKITNAITQRLVELRPLAQTQGRVFYV